MQLIILIKVNVKQRWLMFLFFKYTMYTPKPNYHPASFELLHSIILRFWGSCFFHCNYNMSPKVNQTFSEAVNWFKLFHSAMDTMIYRKVCKVKPGLNVLFVHCRVIFSPHSICAWKLIDKRGFQIERVWCQQFQTVVVNNSQI